MGNGMQGAFRWVMDFHTSLAQPQTMQLVQKMEPCTLLGRLCSLQRDLSPIILYLVVFALWTTMTEASKRTIMELLRIATTARSARLDHYASLAPTPRIQLQMMVIGDNI